MKGIALLAFLLVGSLFTVLFWQGPSTSFDDANYLTYGRQMLNHTYSITESPYAYGSAFLSTIAIGLVISNGQAWGASLPQIIEYLLIICVLYFTLKRYFDPDVSFVMALGIEVSGFIAMYATRALPDMLLGLLISLVFLILAYKKGSSKWMFVAGFLTGATIFVKMGGFVLLILLGMGTFGILALAGIIIILAFLLLCKDMHRVYYILGLLLAIVIYQLLLPHGVSVIAMANAYDAMQVSLSIATIQTNISAIIINTIGYLPPYANQIFPIGLIGILGILGTIYILLKKDRRLYFAVLAFWISVIYFYFGTESLTSYTFITVVSRYFIEFAAPMVLLAASPIQALTIQVGRYRHIALGLVLVLIVFSNVLPYLIFYHHVLNYVFAP
jgi:hypothetical protein